MKAADAQRNRMCGLLPTFLVVIGTVVVACAATQVKDDNKGPDSKGVYPKVDFPTTDYGYGNAFHLLFSFDGDSKHANEWRHVSEKGIADDPRVQEFVDNFRATLAKYSFVVETTDFREARALGFLNEPVYRSGYRLADAEVTTEIRNGKPEKYYQWRGSDGQYTAGAFEDELAEIGDDLSARRWKFENTLRAVYGRHKPGIGYTDFLQLCVGNRSVAFYATEPRHFRHSELFRYGVMGIVARAETTPPQGLVQQVDVTISTQPNAPARPIDELIVEALNASLGEGEVVQFYPHSGLDEFGDTDERVQYFKENVVRSILIEEEQRKD